jgi:hypothetical protein
MDGPDPFFRELARLVAKAAAALYAQTKGEKTNISLLIGGGEAAEATPGQDTVSRKWCRRRYSLWRHRH